MELRTGDVERAYAAVFACLDAYDRFRETCGVMSKASWRPNEYQRPPDDLLEKFHGLRSVTLKACEDAECALEPIREVLHLTSEGTVTVGRAAAPSVAEAVVATLPKELRLRDLDFAEPCSQTQWWLHDHEERVEHLHGVRSDLQIECARVKDRVRREGAQDVPHKDGLWTCEGGLVTFDGPLRKLRGQSRRLMRHMILRYGRQVVYEELADQVWGDPYTDENTIQKAFSALRKDLRAAGLDDLAGAIKNVRGAYQLLC